MIIEAAQFAKQAHEGQFRKYNGRPYITHPIRVAGRVATHPLANNALVQAAFLHDVVEDCWVTIDDIGKQFGPFVAEYVQYLTNPPKTDGQNRAARKQADLMRIALIPKEAKLVKLIDRIDNLLEMDTTIDFAKVYAQESLSLLEVLRGVDIELELEFETLAKGLLGG